MTYTIQIQRQARRSIKLTVQAPNIITVVAPLRLHKHAISQFIYKKEKWIQTALKHSCNAQHYRNYASNEPSTLYYLGYPYPIVFQPISSIIFKDNTICIPTTYTTSKIEKWLKEKASDIFQDRLDYYASQMGVSYDTLKVKTLRARWGSCSSQKIITLNWKLIFFKLDIIDYVVIHELAHLKHMNHSSQFWSAVKKVQPDYKQHHLFLKTVGVILKP